ncbi:nucleotidyltransferase domain-containing protein [Streptomyces graminifolii]|uniref:nucleotidyltransferase domain-containing protein n=1 Tax=Streptomyces TaxID=1883 RepID=UPI0036A1C70D
MPSEIFPVSMLTDIGSRIVTGTHADAAIAYISGSLVEGYGTETSDLDIYVVYDNPTPQQVPEDRSDLYAIETDFVGELRTDTEVWSLQWLTDLADRISGWKPMDWLGAQSFENRDLDLAHRFRIGLPILGEDRFHALYERFDWQRLAGIIMLKRFLAYTGAAEDAIGSVDAGRPVASMLHSRDALGYAVDALLSAHGNTNPKPKWREAKLTDLGDDTLTKLYTEAELDRSSEPADLTEGAKRRLSVASGIAAEVLAVALEA